MKLKRKRIEVPTTLNITSLLDVLTVLLFFLIKMFSVSSANITLPEGLVLADTNIKNQMTEATSLAINKDTIWIDTKSVVSIRGGHIASKDLLEDGKTIKVVHEFLKKEMEKRNKLYQTNKANAPLAKLIIKADKQVPFSLLKLLLHTATLAGYTEYQFLVRTDN